MTQRQQAVLFLVSVVVVAALVECLGVSQAVHLRQPARRRALLMAIAVHGVLGLILQPANLVISNLSVAVTSVLAATALGRGLRNRNSLVAFALAASAADIVSFAVGPTRALLDRFGGATGTLVSYLALTVTWQGQRVPVVGIGDLILLGSFYLALQQLGFGTISSVAPPVVGLLLALAIGLLTGGVFGIPFMAATVLAAVYLRR